MLCWRKGERRFRYGQDSNLMSLEHTAAICCRGRATLQRVVLMTDQARLEKSMRGFEITVSQQESNGPWHIYWDFLLEADHLRTWEKSLDVNATAFTASCRQSVTAVHLENCTQADQTEVLSVPRSMFARSFDDAF